MTNERKTELIDVLRLVSDAIYFDYSQIEKGIDDLTPNEWTSICIDYIGCHWGTIHDQKELCKLDEQDLDSLATEAFPFLICNK